MAAGGGRMMISNRALYYIMMGLVIAVIYTAGWGHP